LYVPDLCGSRRSLREFIQKLVDGLPLGTGVVVPEGSFADVVLPVVAARLTVDTAPGAIAERNGSPVVRLSA
jgi:hypothetical protein